MKGLLVRLTLVYCFFPVLSLAQEPGKDAAQVVALQGTVYAWGVEGERRILARRDGIKVGDVLETSGDAWLQLRFSDNALLALNCASELQLRDYQYLDRPSDRVELHLAEGRMRTITGAIQFRNYRFTTDIAEIEVSGTDYEVEIVSETENTFGVYDGAITVSNAIDSVFIGLDRAFDFAKVIVGDPPERLANSPFRISNTLLSGTQRLC
ncbi:MAG: FecR family protein [Gammaproteobacteria bacterium]|nr:FecR family protein [Gammaproteobacteria bacterium]MDD9959518.1 FecR family protein [Gammaproteobacteria bacterium]